MPDPREITDVAIDSALHQIAEPRNGWRSLIPPSDLGQMLSAGSGQITLQALVAILHYGNTAERAWAAATLDHYADVCWERYMLSEPWSEIYGGAILGCWVAVVVIATRLGLYGLAQRFTELIEAWAATCKLMEARLESGDLVVMTAGCRSWGHKIHGNFDVAWPIAMARKMPAARGSRAYGTPGAYDDWGWIGRCYSIGAEILRSAADKFRNLSVQRLLEVMPKWAARTEMQLVGYEDGSRLWAMGDDEVEFDDEDQNSNTPGRMLAGVLRRTMIAFPAWPNPVDGVERVRQQNVRADLDGDPVRGFSIWSSHFGSRRGPHPATGESGFLSELPPYTASPILFWITIKAGDRNWIDKLKNVTPAPQPGPTPQPTPPAGDCGPKPRKPGWWRGSKAKRAYRVALAAWEACRRTRS